VRRFRWRRLSVYIEPRDWWVGLCVAPEALYFCPLPCVVFKVARRVMTRWLPANDSGEVRTLPPTVKRVTARARVAIPYPAEGTARMSLDPFARATPDFGRTAEDHPAQGDQQ